MEEQARYDDGLVACDQTGVLIRHYYPWGSKRIPYARIRDVRRVALAVHRWRIWGSDDLRHWWNLDRGRPRKHVALEIRAGHWVIPTITPDDADAVERLITEHRLLGR